jgi:hypothetical protein
LTTTAIPTSTLPTRNLAAGSVATEVIPLQLLFRELNEQISSRGRHDGRSARTLECVCECERRGCDAEIRITTWQYESVRRFPTRFIVRPGHTNLSDERVIEERDGYMVVEKTGPSAHLAVRLDPRGGHRRLRRVA